MKTVEEWMKQADYDIETAQSMFDTGRYIYTIFMCHLSIEKALKGLFTKVIKEIPPKIHDLLYLIRRIDLELEENEKDIIIELNELSIPTRYPEELNKLIRIYKVEKTKNLLLKSKEVL